MTPTDDSTANILNDYSLNTCIHFTSVLEVIAARSVHEAVLRVSDTLDRLVGVGGTPPTVRRWIAVQPVCRRVDRCRRLVQGKPVVSTRAASTTHHCHYVVIYGFSLYVN